MDNTPSSLGGQARAAALSPEKRSEIAAKASHTYWDKKNGIPRAEYSGELKLGSILIPCHVLSDGTRVVTETGFRMALGLYSPSKVHGKTEDNNVHAKYPTILGHLSIKPFIYKYLPSTLPDPIKFRTKEGVLARGVRAEIIPLICRVWFEAYENNSLSERLSQVGIIAKSILLALSQVGIVALVDEATGFQRVRSLTALERLCEKFISEDLRPWIRAFPKRFFTELARVRGLELNGKRPPQYFGHIVNNLTYKRLAPGILQELKKKAERYQCGKLKNPMHRFLTENHGHPKLREHISNLVTLMKITDDGDYDGFMEKVDKVLPVLTNAEDLSEDQIEQLVTLSEDEDICEEKSDMLTGKY